MLNESLNVVRLVWSTSHLTDDTESIRQLHMTNRTDDLSLDKNLQLALLDEIQDKYDWVEEMSEEYERMRPNNPKWVPWTTIEEGDLESYSSLEQFLLTLQLKNEKLLEIDRLTLDGDRDVYQWIYANWWDLGDHFVIRNLNGIEKCQSITYLHLGQGLVEGCSLLPLKALPKLSELWICESGRYRDIDALLHLPKLEKINVSNWESSDNRHIWEQVIENVNG